MSTWSCEGVWRKLVDYFNAEDCEPIVINGKVWESEHVQSKETLRRWRRGDAMWLVVIVVLLLAVAIAAIVGL